MGINGENTGNMWNLKSIGEVITKVAYARVSTEDQSLNLQIDALKRVGFDKIFTDHGKSGVDKDRLARSMREMTDTIWALHNRGIGFYSICKPIDVNSAFGEFTLHFLNAVAHFERTLIVERTRAGMAAAKEGGVKFRRKPALNGEELSEALFLMHKG